MSSNPSAGLLPPSTVVLRSLITAALAILAVLAGIVSPLFVGPTCLTILVVAFWLAHRRRTVVSPSIMVLLAVGLASSVVALLFLFDPSAF